MKRFWLFAWSEGEAFGGMYDFKGDFDSYDEALGGWIKASKDSDCGQIYDTRERKTVMLMDTTSADNSPDSLDQHIENNTIYL
jgi:hypothetical protein